MEYRSLGRTGVQVSTLCIGCMNFGAASSEAESTEIIHAALDIGINFLDTANGYAGGESERIVGRALAGRRHEVVLATKVYFPTGSGPNERGLSRYNIINACEASLRSLNTDHIDLYQLHRPVFDIPADEWLRALDDLIRAGKVRYIGVSTYPAWLTVEAIHTSEKLGLNRFISETPPYNLLDRRIENELVPMAQRYGLAILPWSPLGGGVLAGKYPVREADEEVTRLGQTALYKERISRRARVVAEHISAVADAAGMKMAQLGLLWVKEQPGITSVIIGPRTMQHLTDALSIYDLTLSADVAAQLDEINPPGTAVANYHNNSNWMKMKLPLD